LKSIEIITKEPIQENIEVVDDGIEIIDLPTINIKLSNRESDENNDTSEYQKPPIIDLLQTNNETH
jgi:hypothetical protein